MREPLSVILVHRPPPQPPSLTNGDDHPERRQRDQKRRGEKRDCGDVVDARAVIPAVDEPVRVVVAGHDGGERRDPDKASDDEQTDGCCAETSPQPCSDKRSTHEREQRDEPDLNPDGGHQAARTPPTPSTTRASDGTYASSICQYGYR